MIRLVTTANFIQNVFAFTPGLIISILQMYRQEEIPWMHFIPFLILVTREDLIVTATTCSFLQGFVKLAGRGRVRINMIGAFFSFKNVVALYGLSLHLNKCFTIYLHS